MHCSLLCFRDKAMHQSTSFYRTILLRRRDKVYRIDLNLVIAVI